VREPYPDGLPQPDLVLHAAAWTNVDGAEDDQAGAFAINEAGTRTVVSLGAPVVYFSTDYVFDGRQRAPYVESDEPAPLSVYAESKLAGERHVREGWVVRSSWLFGATGHNFVRTMLRLGAEEIFRKADLTCEVRRISSSEYGAPAARPPYSVLRSERNGAPRLPHWREGLSACLERLG
jgi:dTDP-4-dehydrorhamnose reductase